MCTRFVVFTDCESCTRPISTNPGSMETGEYGLARETCFVARRLEEVAVARSPRASLCVLGVFFFEYTRPIASTRPPGLIYLSTDENYRDPRTKTRVENVVSFEYMKVSRFESALLSTCLARNSPGALGLLERSTLPEAPQSPLSRQDSGGHSRFFSIRNLCLVRA